jgi:hypothetical protein
VLDTGAHLTCSGMSSLKHDWVAYGFDYDATMLKMRQSKKKFAFGATVLRSIGIAPLWLVSPGGQIHIAERHVVDHESLPCLLGLDLVVALQCVIAPFCGLMRCLAWQDMNRNGQPVDLHLSIGGDNHLYVQSSPFRMPRPQLSDRS